jgi:hypothetical protein
MRLDAVARGDDALLYMERYVDEGTRTYSPFAALSEAAPLYQPRSPAPSFELVTVRAPREDVSVVRADPQAELFERYVRSDEVLFVIHPETWTSEGIDYIDELHALPRGPSIVVAPTASTRTVLTIGAVEAPHHFLKLHYPRRISRFNRRLRRKNIRTSIEVTRDIAAVSLETFAYLPDSFGITYRDGGNPWGFLVREVMPRPVRPGRRLIPFFSLYGGDLQHPEDPPRSFNSSSARVRSRPRSWSTRS